jgi:chemotaxis protein CheZ
MENAEESIKSRGARDQTTTEVFIKLGTITRLLHDTLAQLGVMPKLQAAAQGLPDARSRLNYIAEKTASAAEKVLNSVDQAKAVHSHMVDQARAISVRLTEDPVRAVASGAVLNFVRDIESSAGRADEYLTDIMLAQDFHDLTGQVVSKVVTLAGDLETSLVQLLVEVVPEDQVHKVEQALNGPVVNPEGRTDVVANQEQVDDLLASLGF